jgi:hypothetical protein
LSSSESPDGALASAINTLSQQVAALRQAVSQLPPVLFELGREARKLLRNPATYIVGVVSSFVFSVFIRPVFEAILLTGQATVGAVQFLFQSLAGFLALGGQIIVESGRPFGASILGELQAFNESVANIVAGAGLGALPIATALLTAEALLFGYGSIYLLTQAVRVIDIPFVNLGPIVDTITAPARAIAEVLR